MKNIQKELKKIMLKEWGLEELKSWTLEGAENFDNQDEYADFIRIALADENGNLNNTKIEESYLYQEDIIEVLEDLQIY